MQKKIYLNDLLPLFEQLHNAVTNIFKDKGRRTSWWATSINYDDFIINYLTVNTTTTEWGIVKKLYKNRHENNLLQYLTNNSASTSLSTFFNLKININLDNIYVKSKSKKKDYQDYILKKDLDTIFERSGIKKQTRKAASEKLKISELNTFTLAAFNKAYKESSLLLADIKRIISEYSIFTVEWSNTILSKMKSSIAGYKYVYEQTKDSTAEIYNLTVWLGETYIQTPTENYHRHANTEKIFICLKTNLTEITHIELTKALIQAKVDTPIYNYIINYLHNDNYNKDNLAEYLHKLTAIYNQL